MSAPVSHRQGYTDDDFAAILKGGYLPNAEEILAAAMLNNIAAHRYVERHGSGRHPGADHTSWAHYFLTQGQGGGLTGEGYAVIYSGEWDAEAKAYKGGKAYRFAICKHEITGTGTAAEAQRGWYPGHCGLCGLDMTVDSGD